MQNKIDRIKSFDMASADPTVVLSKNRTAKRAVGRPTLHHQGVTFRE